MKGDFTRSTWNPTKRYSGVRQQQGRVQTDADWNEQVDIGTYLRETSLGDLIGRCGAPRTGGGFKVGLNGDATDLTLSAGRLYVDGILCELAPDTTYTAQLAGLDPALSAALKPALPAATGTCFVYADVWQRHVTALEDPAIRETALGGPDTATRTQTFWQVKLLPVDAGSHCLSTPRAWLSATAAPTGKLRARTHPGEPPTEPCIVPANAGYTRLENQLYRVEVHQEGSLSARTATFKWSRDNGSVISEWLSLDNADPKKPKLTVRDIGRDATLGFSQGQWVEVTDDVHEVQGSPGVLAKLLDVQGTVLTLDLAAGPALNLADFPVHPKVRRWDSAGAVTIDQPAGNDGWLPLEGGVEVRFEDGTYRTGDYWLIPARAFIGEFSGDVEWPRDGGNPAAMPPGGVTHHFCKLAVVDFDAGTKKLSNVRDCRLLFPAVTELIHLFHVGGDGQEALPGQALACPLEVGVTNGQWPVPGARVEFQASAGTVSASSVQTDAGGVARCTWTLPAAPPDGRISCLSVTATLRDVAGNPISIPVVFHAGMRLDFSLYYVGGDGQEGAPGKMLPQPLEARVANGRSPQAGSQVRFRVVEGKGTLGRSRTDTALAPELTVATDAGGLAACFWTFGDDGADPRQRVEAVLLDGAGSPAPGQVIHFNADHTLGRDPGIVIRRVVGIADRGPLDNDSLVNMRRFLDGLQVLTDRKPADVFSFPPVITGATALSFPPRPNFQVILHLPCPPAIANSVLGDGSTVGFFPLLLAGGVTVVDTGAQWVPGRQTRAWLGNLFNVLNPNHTPGSRLLVQVILKGNFIWSADDSEVFLDGESFGRNADGQVDLRFPSGDGRRGGDFEMWLWLVPDPTGPILTASASGNAIVGSVRDPTGAPLPGIKISLLIPGGTPLSAVTSATGDFRFPQVPNGRLTVQVQIPGGPTLTQDVQVGPVIFIPNPPVNPNPVILNPVVLNPLVAQPAGPVELGEPSAQPAPAGGAPRLTDVRGIGRARAAQLAGGGINTPADLAAAEPARVAEVLGVPEETARTLVESAKAALGS
ncbi:MAG TPA: DUF6519 domain-containing protein [Thermoanaerobaculia bacterium]